MAVLYFKNPETGAFEPLSVGGGGSAIDDTTPSTVTVYSSKKTQDEIDRLDEQINEQKEAIDEEVDKKANDADLAAVAKSGSYNDLTNKPTIPTVPSALPNPFPLTINGTQYDGSKAVSVNVEGGGTGGMSGFKYVDTFDLSSGALRYDLDVADANEFLLVVVEAANLSGGVVEFPGINSSSFKSFTYKNVGKMFMATKCGDDGVMKETNRGDTDALIANGFERGTAPIFSGVYLNYSSASAGKIALYKR